MFFKFKNILFFIIIIVILISGFIFVDQYQFKHNLTYPQPISQVLSQTTKNNEPQKKFIIYGFLPFWNIKKFTNNRTITHLNYFSLNLDSDGVIKKKDQQANLEPSYLQFSRSYFDKIYQNDKNKLYDLTLFAADNEIIDELINNPETIQVTISSLQELIKDRENISGFNLDFEYSKKFDPEKKQAFNQYLIKLAQALKENFHNARISISVYSSAATQEKIWDLAKLADSCDFFVVMAYDFHRASSYFAGPNSPLIDSKKYLKGSIQSYLQDFLKVIPREKIVLALPFYGYQWQVENKNPLAPTINGRTMTLEAIAKLKKDANYSVKELWLENFLTPYLEIQKDDKIFLLHYENSQSWQYKIDLVKKLDLAGIAIWALGYEADDEQIWQVVEKSF